MSLLDELNNSALPFIQKVGEQAKNVADQYRYITGAPVQAPQTVAPAANAAGTAAPLDQVSGLGVGDMLQTGLKLLPWALGAFLIYRLVKRK